jgi:hypothetical protein
MRQAPLGLCCCLCKVVSAAVLRGDNVVEHRGGFWAPGGHEPSESSRRLRAAEWRGGRIYTSSGCPFGFNARRPTSRRLVAISTGSWVRPKAAPETLLLRDFMSRDESAEAHSTLVESESPTAQMAVRSGAPAGDAREGAQETEDCLTSLEREPKCSICD